MSIVKFLKGLTGRQTAEKDAPPPATPKPEVTTPKAVSPLPAVSMGGMNIKVNYGTPGMTWGAQAAAAPKPPAQPSFEQALALHKQGQLAQAQAMYQAVLAAEPQHANALHYLGLVHLQQGQPDEGIARIQASLAVDPHQFAALGNLANALQEAGRHEEALASLDSALAIKADSAPLWHNRGALLLGLKQAAEAADSFQRALRLNPQLAATANLLAASLALQGQDERALAAADQALAADPQLADAHDTRGSALRRLHRLPEALASYERAMALQPANTDYLANRCSVLEDMDHYEAALAGLRQLKALRPDFKCINGRLVHAQRRCMDWTGLADLTQQVINATEAGQLSDAPLNMLAITASAKVQLDCARQALTEQAQFDRLPMAIKARQTGDKVRVAYVSGDLREHAVSYLMAGVFEAHDRQHFEVIAISLKPAQDSAMGHRVQAAFDAFHDVSHMTDEQIVALVRSLHIDIAVDLMGLTFGARPLIWAQGLAPVQVSYLGYPGTTGAPYMDYILADETVIPPDQQAHYSERVAYLPGCFQANDRARVIDSHTPDRATLGLPDHAFVFAAFNNLYKIGPDTFDSWMRILNAVPDSVLWLVDDQAVARHNARQQAQARGVNPERLVFAPRAPYAQHLARIKQADLFLDTLPFNAGTTASDALWVGLPVLTLPGQAFASRMAASLLNAIGLPELIAPDLATYEARAIELSAHRDQLQAIKTRLDTARLSCTLFDTDRFTRNLEAAFLDMLKAANA